MGDPLGIGPEVLALALADPAVQARLDPVVFGDRATLLRAATLRGVPLEARVVQVGKLAWQPTGEEAGVAALEYVDCAAQAVVVRQAKALCTAPLSKERVALRAPQFVGHTEHLARTTGARVAMMLAGPRLRVVLATTHLALAEVPRRLSAEQIAFVAQLVSRELRERWGIASPRIAVCGLNPHAGEGGSATRRRASWRPPSRRPAPPAWTPPDRILPTASSPAPSAAIATRWSRSTTTRA